MKRFLLVIALAAALLGLFAAPASAWYAPQLHTAYVPTGIEGGGWIEWTGSPSDPFKTIDHTDAIPYGWKVVVSSTWFDSRLGATLIPAESFHTMAISKVRDDGSNGSPIFAITTAVRGLRYWSPAYKWGDPNEDPRFWARDWWVPLGKLPPGKYSGWVREFAPRAFPTWDGGTVLPLGSPIMVEPYDITLPISFSVRCVK